MTEIIVLLDWVELEMIMINVQAYDKLIDLK